jgi:hypothetical protein
LLVVLLSKQCFEVWCLSPQLISLE